MTTINNSKLTEAIKANATAVSALLASILRLVKIIRKVDDAAARDKMLDDLIALMERAP